MDQPVPRQLEAREIAAWLRAHPTFFIQHPDVALAVELPRQSGQATSLASYQLEVLRDKNRELTRRLQELFAIANENERLVVRTQQLTLALMRARSLEQSLSAAVASLREDFNSEWVRILLPDTGDGLAESPWWRSADRSGDEFAAFADFLAAGEPLCGRLQPRKLEVLFGDDREAVQSVALLPMGEFGLLAIGSSDPNRFYPGMGTLFLRLMSEALETAVSRYRAGADSQ